MAKFTIPYNRVSYAGREDVYNSKYFDAYWGADLTGDYGSNPYKFTITKANLTLRWKYKNNSETQGTRGLIVDNAGIGSGTLTIRSYKGTSGSIYDSVGIPISTSGNGCALDPGESKLYTGSKTGSYTLDLHPEGGKLRAYLRIGGMDLGLIWSSEYYPSDYKPVNPDMNISFGSDGVNDIKVVLNSSITTDLSSYTYSIKIYSDAGRTNLVKEFKASDLNGFPLHWNGATPGTTYYWTADLSGTNSKTGGAVSMPQKTGSMTTMKPTVATESFSFTATPLYNGHWTPRTKILFNISNHSNSDHSAGLTFKNFQIITALNGLNRDEKEYRTSVNDGSQQTLVLTDTSKVKRAVKPRDLFYMKIRVCCVDNAGREYFSDTFGILTPQYIYNWFHMYLTRPSINEQLRVNNKIAFSGKTSENYINKGEVK